MGPILIATWRVGILKKSIHQVFNNPLIAN